MPSSPHAVSGPRVRPSIVARALLPLLLLCASSLAGCARDHARPSGPSEALPLRTLRLYETGVGYFERSGEVTSHVSALPVPAGHLDDALKSLVVLQSGGGGHVSGVAFGSSVTRATARARAGLPLDPEEPITFRHLLVSMKGERVVLSMRGSKGSASGRVIEVTTEPSRETDDNEDEESARLMVNLLGTDGEVRTIAADDITAIRPTDPAVAQRLDAALDALSTRTAQNARSLRLLGQTRGPVTFGYIAETPIWRASYRLVGSPDAPGGVVLQGWALVHNDTDESWRGIRLELVNGEPESFLFPFAAPRYARRELAHPDHELSTVPQLQSTTADAMWGDHIDELGLSSVGSYGSGYGRGGGRGIMARAPIVTGTARAAKPSVAPSSVLSVGNLAGVEEAEGIETGALFVYTIPEPFSLEARSSALVPFVHRPVTTERIAFFERPSAPARASVRFVNTTGQTLPMGTIAVFDASGFAGETVLDRVKPGERRILEVGNDLDAMLTQKRAARTEESKRLTFEHDRLREHYLATTELDWELENRSAEKRTFAVVVDASSNGTIAGADRIDFDGARSMPIAIFEVPAKSKQSRSVVVTEGLSRTFTMDDLRTKKLAELLANKTIAPPDLAVLARAEPRVRALEADLQSLAAAEAAADAALEDLERLREHLNALGGGEGGGAAAAPLVKRVLDAEDRLAAARAAGASVERKLEEKRASVRETLQTLGTK